MVFPGEWRNAVIPGRPPEAKALGYPIPDGEGRKLGDQKGLETPVVPAVNAAGYLLGGPRVHSVGKGSR